jgi:hypothetical protein
VHKANENVQPTEVIPNYIGVSQQIDVEKIVEHNQNIDNIG